MSTAQSSSTTIPSAEPRAPADRKVMRRVVSASVVGTTLEWYDHFIYGSAATLVFPHLFFPKSDPLTAVMLSLITYAVAFLTRPLGAAIFGHFGDKYGRKHILVITLVLMGTATTLIGLIPTYNSIGIAAPVILIILRFIQGIGLGGEWGGAALLVAEYSKTGKRGILGSLIQIASPLGLLIANAVFSIITYLVSEEAFMSWGWRVPFVSSALLVLTGIWLRLHVEESPLFLEEKNTEKRSPIVDIFKYHWKQLLIAIGSRVGSDSIFYLFNIFTLVYGTTILHYERQTLLNAVIFGAITQAIMVPIWGNMTDKFGRKPILLIGAVGAIGAIFAYFPLMKTGNYALIFLVPVIGNFFIAAMWGPLASFMPELFPTEVRYTGAGVGFQSAGIFGGALAPIVTTWLLKVYPDSIMPIALYFAALIVLLIFSVSLARETANIDLRNV